MSFVVAAVWRARAGKEQRVREVLERMTAPSRAEPGCLVYRVQQREDDPREFFLYEVYRAREDYEAHLASEHFEEHATTVGIPLLASRERTFYETFAD